MVTTKQTNNLKIKGVKPLEIGSILEGTLLSKRKQELYVDLSPYGIGRLYGIFYLQCKDIAQKLKPGDRVGVKIVGLNDGYGNYEILLQDVAETMRWQKLLDYYRSNKILELEIKDANRGGWLVEIEGIQGFIPVSQLSPQYYPRVETLANRQTDSKNLIYEHLKKFVGQKVKCRIVSVDPRQNKLVLSEKAANEETYQEILSRMMIGDILKVRIVSLSPFGIFVRFNEDPPMDGLIHISEIPEEKAVNLSEYFKVGDVLEAKLIQVKQDKASFSLRNLAPDPWVLFAKNYKEKDRISGILKEKNDIFGVVEVGGVHGLVFENLDKLEIGQTYNFVIEKLKPKEKSLILKSE